MTELRTRIADIKFGLYEYRAGERSKLDVDDLAFLVQQIEKLLPVVDEARTLYEESLERNGPMGGNRFADVFALLDGNTTNATRPCPNAVSFCGGPDRYGDTCAACLATWTEEAKEKA